MNSSPYGIHDNWHGPFPRMALPAPLAGYDVTLAEGENALIALRTLQALPGALSFRLQVFGAPHLELSGASAEKVPRRGSTPEFIVEALFSDGPGDEPARVPVEVHSGGGGMGRWDIDYWFRLPDPLPAEIGLAVAWLDAGIQPRVLRIAREDILGAAPQELNFPR